eukprot:1913241-Rhodomonas_salina.1
MPPGRSSRPAPFIPDSSVASGAALGGSQKCLFNRQHSPPSLSSLSVPTSAPLSSKSAGFKWAV